MSSTTSQQVSSFGWNAGGWFGAQLGSTAWLLVGTVMIFPRAPLAGLIWLGSFVVANALGFLLWQRRDHIRAYTAYQLFFLLLTVLYLVCTLAVDLSGVLPDLAGPSSDPRLTVYGTLLIFPAVMTFFYIFNRTRA